MTLRWLSRKRREFVHLHQGEIFHGVHDLLDLVQTAQLSFNIAPVAHGPFLARVQGSDAARLHVPEIELFTDLTTLLLRAEVSKTFCMSRFQSSRLLSRLSPLLLHRFSEASRAGRDLLIGSDPEVPRYRRPSRPCEIRPATGARAILFEHLAENSAPFDLGFDGSFQPRAEASEDFQFEKLQIVELHMAGFLGDAPLLRFAANARNRFRDVDRRQEAARKQPASK